MSSSSSSSNEPITTTTTTPSPLRNVKTDFFEKIGSEFFKIENSDASDSDTSINTVRAFSFNFGTLAPGETSKTIIVALDVPHADAIGNVKIGLINPGGIAFANNIFGIASSSELSDNIVPDQFFQGINVEESEISTNNIIVDNRLDNVSNYVYLNISLPVDNFLGEGVVRYQWFFDHAS